MAKNYQNFPKMTLYQCITPKKARTELWSFVENTENNDSCQENN